MRSNNHIDRIKNRISFSNEDKRKIQLIIEVI